jgi:hypothetical protein
MDPPWASGPWDAGYYDTTEQKGRPLSKTFSRCQDCNRMEYIVDGGCVCEPCFKLDTQSKILLSHADHEIANLRTQLSAMQARAERAERLYELAWAECLAWRAYEIEACDHACDPPVSIVNAHDTARSKAGREGA